MNIVPLDKTYQIFDWIKSESACQKNPCLNSMNPTNPPEDFMRLVAAASASRLHKSALVEALIKIRECEKQLPTKLYAICKKVGLHYVCCPYLPGGFMSDVEKEECKNPTIIWDPYADFTYYSLPGDVSRTGSKHRLSSTNKGMKAKMPAWMVLAHELGHYQQYLKSKSNFRRMYEEQRKPQGYPTLDMDNLVKHENPFQKLNNFAVRHFYYDIPPNSDVHRKWKSSPSTYTYHWTYHEESLSPAIPGDALDSWGRFNTYLETQNREFQRKAAAKSTRVVHSKVECPYCDASGARISIKTHIQFRHQGKANPFA